MNKCGSKLHHRDGVEMCSLPAEHEGMHRDGVLSWGNLPSVCLSELHDIGCCELPKDHEGDHRAGVDTWPVASRAHPPVLRFEVEVDIRDLTLAEFLALVDAARVALGANASRVWAHFAREGGRS